MDVYKYMLLHLCGARGRNGEWYEWKPRKMHELPKLCSGCKAPLRRFGGKYIVCDPISVIFFYRDKELEIYDWKGCPEKYKEPLQKAVKKAKKT